MRKPNNAPTCTYIGMTVIDNCKCDGCIHRRALIESALHDQFMAAFPDGVTDGDLYELADWVEQEMKTNPEGLKKALKESHN